MFVKAVVPKKHWRNIMLIKSNMIHRTRIRPWGGEIFNGDFHQHNSFTHYYTKSCFFTTHKINSFPFFYKGYS
jgi:hypothetical protein